MKIAIYTSKKTVSSGKRLLSNSYIFRQVKEISKYFDKTDVITIMEKGVDEAPLGFNEIDTSSFDVLGITDFRGWRNSLLSRGRWGASFVKLFYLLYKRIVLFYQRRKEWDLIIFWGMDFTTLPLLFVLLLFKKPTVVFIGYDVDMMFRNSEDHSFDKKIKQCLIKITYKTSLSITKRFAHTIVTGSELFEKYSDYSRDRVHKIITSVMDKKDIDVDAMNRRTYNHDELKLLLVCRIVPEKSIDNLLMAVKKVRSQGLKLSLDILGPVVDQKYFQYIRILCENFSIENTVSFVGAVEHSDGLWNYYENADVFVLPSSTEGTPKVLPEAMAKGLPIICTRVGGVPDIVKEDENAILLDPGNVGQMVDAIWKLFADPELRKKMSIRSVELAAEFTVQNQMKHFADILKTIGEKEE